MLATREKKRFIIFFIVAILLPTLAIITRLFFLQFLQQEELERLAKEIYIKEEILEEVRGTIYDRAGRELAVSIEVDSLYANPAKLVSKRIAAQRLAPILRIDQGELFSKLTSPSRFVWVKRKIDPAEREEVLALKIEGLGFIKEYKRVYPKGRLAAHLLGFVGLDNRGLEGIERHFDQYLRGKTERIRVVKDARGDILRILPREGETPSFRGCDLVLTIDGVIQHTAEEELKRVVAKYRAKGGSIVIMDPRSGQILALAIEPSFNPNRFWEFKNSVWRNRVVTDAFEPGSTLKAITFSAALGEGLIDLKERILCPGFIEVAGHRIRCHKKHGWLTFREVLEESCNVGAIEAAHRLNPKKFYEYIRSFGFGTITGIALPGEACGTLRRPSNWSGLSQASLAIGQEILVTHLQLAVATSALTNGGRLIEPLIVKEIRDQEGRTVKEFKPIYIRETLSFKTLQMLKGLLEGVVLRGTGQEAQLVGYRVYGKTGTAQKFDPALGRYSKDRLISSFIGWAEAGGRRIAILVVIDEPKGESWGGIVAAPAFRRVAQKILPYLDIFPEETILAMSVDSPNQTLKSETLSTSTPAIMPDVCGMAMRGVHRLLSSYGVREVFEGSGVAVSQSPAPGTKLSPGMRVKIYFEGG